MRSRRDVDSAASSTTETSSSLSVAKRAIEIVIRHLSVLAASPQGVRLMGDARAQLAEVEGWALSPPGSARRNDLMKRTLQLYFEVVRLERASGLL